MNERSISFAQRAFTPLLLLGILDRLYLLFVFGFKYVGNDDGVIWSAAMDYGHRLFHEPYFYGQDYAFMLEALIAAPFARMGVPLNILMPTVTSLLALAPFWSFALWHRKNHRPLAALIFLAMPLLLPVQYGLMTMVTRCFVSGIAPLALLPWLLDLRDRRATALLIGLVCSMAAFINPNSIVFSVAFAVYFVLSGPKFIRNCALLALGALPFAGVYLAAQAYCGAHPERMLNILDPAHMGFTWAELGKGLSNLDQHFAWLSPLTWTVGSMVFILLLLSAVASAVRRDRPGLLSLTAALAVVLYALGVEKVHDGTMNAFFPYSRMFLALPLLLCWALAEWRPSARAVRMVPLLLLVGCSVTLVVKCFATPQVIHAQTQVKHIPVSEVPIAFLQHDAQELRRLCELHDVQLIVASKQLPGIVGAEYPCFLYPVLEPALPPTYRYGYERRFWQREKFANMVCERVLVIGGSIGDHGTPTTNDPDWIDVSISESGPLLLIKGNTLPTDSLMVEVIRIDQAQ